MSKALISELLVTPRSRANFFDIRRVWREAMQHLPTSLQMMVRNDVETLAGLEAALDQWLAYFVEIESESEASQAEAAVRLVRCGRLAADHPSADWDALERLYSGSGAPCDNEIAWNVECTGRLLGLERNASRVDVYVATTDTLRRRGDLAMLLLETLEPGRGRIFHDPADALVTFADEEFTRAMTLAWRAAWHGSPGGIPGKIDGRWRLLDQSGNPEAARLTGRSAGGAAAVGWCHALNRTIPDDRVIVLAGLAGEADSRSTLMVEGVAGIGPKVQAIIRDGRFDTIMVTQSDRAGAESALNALGRSHRIRIISLQSEILPRPAQVAEQPQAAPVRTTGTSPAHPTTITGRTLQPQYLLQSARSRSAERAELYLKALAARLEDSPWYRYGTPMKVGDIMVEPLVFARTEQLIPGHGSGPSWQASGESTTAPEHFGATAYELAMDMEHRELHRWSSLCLKPDLRAVIVGAPGSGKTFVTRHTVAEATKTSLKRLQSGVVPLDHVEIPIWVTAESLAKSKSITIGQALVEAVNFTFSEATLSTNLREWLVSRIPSAPGTRRESPGLLIVIDGLDELPPGAADAFERRSRQLDELGARVIVTCRSMQWADRRQFLGWVPGDLLELAPLNRDRQRRLVRHFFPEEGPHSRARSLQRAMMTGQSLRRACSSPLVLTFVCLLHQEKPIGDEILQTELYARVITRLLEGRWRAPLEEWETLADFELEYMRAFLGEVAWTLFSHSPQTNHFSLAACNSAIQDAQTAAARAHGEPASVSFRKFEGRLYKWLQRLGILVPAGLNDQGEVLVSFVHRTLLEFLAASRLSRNKPGEIMRELRRHAFLEPAWSEVLRFLSGLMTDATSLLSIVPQDEYDPFGAMLLLKCMIIGSARRVEPLSVNGILDEVFEFWECSVKQELDWSRRLALSLFEQLSRHRGSQDEIAKRLLRYLVRASTNERRMLVIEAMGRTGGAPILVRLSSLAEDPDPLIRLHAAEALGLAGDSTHTEQLVKLAVEPDEGVQRRATRALAPICDERAMEMLLNRLGSPTGCSREAVVQAVSLMTHPRAFDALVALLEDNDENCRAWAIAGLVWLEDPRIAEYLLESSKDRAWIVREFVAAGFRDLPTSQSIATLSRLLEDPDPSVSACALMSLIDLGHEESLDHLSTLDRAWAVRDSARLRSGKWLLPRVQEHPDAYLELRPIRPDRRAEILQRVARSLCRPRWRDALARLTIDPSDTVRCIVAEALGYVGGPDAYQSLLKLSVDTSGEVRASAVRALGWVWHRGDSNPIRSFLEDPDDLVRFRAAEALADQRNDIAFGILRDSCRSAHKWRRRAAIAALGASGDPRAEGVLKGLALKDNEFAGEAARALWGLTRALRPLSARGRSETLLLEPVRTSNLVSSDAHVD